MLNDPLKFALVNSTSKGEIAADVNGSATPEVITARRLLEGSGAKGSRYKFNTGGYDYVLSVAHSTSKENAPIVTNRSVVRLDKVILVDSVPKLASAYMVISHPVGIATEAVMAEIVNSVCAFLLLGEPGRTPGIETVWDVTSSGYDSIVQRITSGEA